MGMYAVRILTSIYYDLWHGANKREAMYSVEFHWEMLNQ